MMMKKITLLCVLTICSLTTWAQVLKFTATHKSRYRIDIDTEKVTETIFENQVSNKKFVFDLDAGTLSITGKDHNEYFTLNPPTPSNEGLTGVGVEVASGQIISMVITKGHLSIIYPAKKIMVAYKTQIKK